MLPVSPTQATTAARIACAALCGALVVQPAAAQPETMRIGDQELTQVSEATRSRLFGMMDIYRVGLYMPPARFTVESLRDPGTAKALSVVILYDGSLPDAIPEEWREELMPVLAPGQQQTLRRAFARLRPDDQIAIEYLPKQGTTLKISGREVLADKGGALMGAFLDVWMGQSPVSEDLKRDLMEGLG
jgi:hypothetical protein